MVTIPGFAAKQVEDKKFRAGADSIHPVSAQHGKRHRFIPFAMEDGGRIGAHGQAALRMLAESAVAKGKAPPMSTRVAPLQHLEVVAVWVRRWQQKLSVWLHLPLSRQVLRYLAPSVADGISYSTNR